MKFSCTAILPYYKEGKRALEIVEGVLKIPSVDQIILVDDGSQDGMAGQIKVLFPTVEVVELPQNRGKSGALAAGLKQARGEYVLLLDTDLKNFDAATYERGIQKFQSDPAIDLIVFLRQGDLPLWKLFRVHYVLTGERLLKKSDLEAVLKTRPYRYQIEIAMNRYMMNHHKQVYSMQTKSLIVYKTEKSGFFRGNWQELKTGLEIYSFAGPFEYWKQLLFFCRQQLS